MKLHELLCYSIIVVFLQVEYHNMVIDNLCRLGDTKVCDSSLCCISDTKPLAE